MAEWGTRLLETAQACEACSRASFNHRHCSRPSGKRLAPKTPSVEESRGLNGPARQSSELYKNGGGWLGHVGVVPTVHVPLRDKS